MNSHVQQLHQSLQGFSQQWDLTKLVWKDRIAMEFQTVYLGPILDSIQSAVQAMNRLDEALTSARNHVAQIMSE